MDLSQFNPLKQWVSTCALQPLCKHLSPNIFALWFIILTKLELWSNDEMILWVRGHHNIRSCIKGSQHRVGWEPLHQDICTLYPLTALSLIAFPRSLPLRLHARYLLEVCFPFLPQMSQLSSEEASLEWFIDLFLNISASHCRTPQQCYLHILLVSFVYFMYCVCLSFLNRKWLSWRCGHLSDMFLHCDLE